MKLEQLVEIIHTEKHISSALKSIGETSDEVVHMYIAEAPSDYKKLTHLVLYGLKTGLDFDILHAQDFMKATNISDLEEHLSFQTVEHSQRITLSSKDREEKVVHYAYGERTPQSPLVDTMGKSFKCDDEDSLRESAIDFLEHENAITIHVYSKPDCTISKKELQRYGATIAKELSYSKGKDFVACEYNGQKISFRKKRVKISIDMEVYNRANTNPGSFHILEEHLQDINNVTKEQRELLESNINSTKPNESEAALLAHVDTSHDFFRHVGFYLKRAKTLPVTDSLKRNFKEKVKTQTEKARELARSLENHTITLEDAISYMTTYDKMFYNSVMRWKELSIVQGALGEVVGLGLMYQLAREYPIEIVEGAVNEYTHVKELGYRITYKKSGKNMLIAIPGHRKNCEIDNMSLYGGVPIIFESKTKKKHTSRSSFEAQKKFISRLYGVKPVFVEVKISDYSYFTEVSPEKYRMTLPLKHDLVQKAKAISERGEEI